jgi:RNA polymerase sigma factor (sigma-70 family)
MYEPWVRHARQRTFTRADAEDAVQSAAVDCLRADPKVESDEHANAYMYAAIRSKAKRHGRTRRQDRGTTVLPWSHRRLRDPSAPSPLDIALHVEQLNEDRRLLELARKGLEQLAPELKEAVNLVVFRDPKTPLRVVAEIQGVSISTVHRRVMRGLDALRKVEEVIQRPPADDDDNETG